PFKRTGTGGFAPFGHSPHGLLASNRSTGTICPAGRLEAPHPVILLNAELLSLSRKGRGDLHNIPQTKRAPVAPHCQVRPARSLPLFLVDLMIGPARVEL